MPQDGRIPDFYRGILILQWQINFCNLPFCEGKKTYTTLVLVIDMMLLFYEEPGSALRVYRIFEY